MFNSLTVHKGDVMDYGTKEQRREEQKKLKAYLRGQSPKIKGDIATFSDKSQYKILVVGRERNRLQFVKIRKESNEH